MDWGQCCFNILFGMCVWYMCGTCVCGKCVYGKCVAWTTTQYPKQFTTNYHFPHNNAQLITIPPPTPPIPTSPIPTHNTHSVPAYYALILRSLTVLEGLALSADPNYKLLGRAYPYMAKRLLLDPAPELRSSLEELVLIDGRVRWSRMENLLREGSKSSDFNAQVCVRE